MHCNSPTDSIVLDDGEILFILDDETDTEEETIVLSERVKTHVEEEELSIASKERLRMQVTEESPMTTRGTLREKEGKSRKYYCEPGSVDLSLFEEELFLYQKITPGRKTGDG